jgi:hypothetical protein
MLDTTVVLTSCGRHDLLDRTLQSFRAFNTYEGIKRLIVVEDGDGDPAEVCAKHGAELLRLSARMGQTAAIDRAYAEVDTNYIFHLEDDWEFYREGFIEKSRSILEVDPSTLLVWLRAWNDTNGHPLSFVSPDRSFGVMAAGHDSWWYGFTFNPALRRLADYRRIGSVTEHRLENYPWHGGGAHEAALNAAYYKLGYRAVILDETGYVRHIGWGRHVKAPATGEHGN